MDISHQPAAVAVLPGGTKSLQLPNFPAGSALIRMRDDWSRACSWHEKAI
jgi:hypothetical protein